MKKLISSVLAIALVLSMFAAFAVGSMAATPPNSYTGGDLSTYRNALLCEKFGGNVDDYTTWAWLAPYGARSYDGYDATIWGLICDDIDKIDAIKGSRTWDGIQFSNQDWEGRAAIRLMNVHIAAISSGVIAYSTNDLNTFRNYLLCAVYGGDYTDYTTWGWLASYNSATAPEGTSQAAWTTICGLIDWFDANRRTCTDAEGQAKIIELSRAMGKSLNVEQLTFFSELDSTSPYYNAAVASKTQLLAAGEEFSKREDGPAATITAAASWFGIFYNRYYTKFTLDAYKNLPEVVAYKALIDDTFNALYAAANTGKVFYGFVNLDTKLETAWGTARANSPVSNGWNNLRQTIVDNECEALWANPEGADADGVLCSKYTTTSWNTYWAAVVWGDGGVRDRCTDAEGLAALNNIKTTYAALEVNPSYVGPINAANKAAFDFCLQNIAGTELYMWYVNRATNLFITPALWTNAQTVQAFIDKANEADELFLEYNDKTDYTAWVVYDNNGAIQDMILEAMWTSARQYAYIGPILQTMRDQIRNTVGSSDLYTADSYTNWGLVWTDASNLIDNTKNNSAATDQDGYDAVQACKDTLETLEPIKEANATYNYYAKQAAKLEGVVCDFNDEFAALDGFMGTATAFDTAVKALATSFDAARAANVFGAAFTAAVAKLNAQYGGDAAVAALCTADQVRILANTGSAADCAAYITNINTAIAAIDAETSAKITAKTAIFGNSNRGTFTVNYKTAYNGYAKLVTLDANKGEAYNSYIALLADYNAASAANSELLTAEEYENMRLDLEHAWWAMRKAAKVGLVFKAEIAAIAAAGNAAQQDYVAAIAPAFYSTATDAQCADAIAAITALA